MARFCSQRISHFGFWASCSNTSTAWSSVRLLRLPPGKAGETIVRGIERRRERVLIGADAYGLALLVRLVPVRYWRIVERFTAG